MLGGVKLRPTLVVEEWNSYHGARPCKFNLKLHDADLEIFY
jgi:hypothetical protein